MARRDPDEVVAALATARRDRDEVLATLSPWQDRARSHLAARPDAPPRPPWRRAFNAVLAVLMAFAAATAAGDGRWPAAVAGLAVALLMAAGARPGPTSR